jgi:NADH-quinone oxidoreductase subunit G
MFEDASAKHADVVFPAEAGPEKDGTMTHPDGRIQRVRTSVPRPGDVRPGWQILTELSAALGLDAGLHTLPEVWMELTSKVAFYSGVTLDAIGGRGVRWQEGPDLQGGGPGGGPPEPFSTPTGSDSVDEETARSGSVEPPPGPPPSGNGLRLGTYRDLWAGEIPERNPALRFLAPEQTLELAPVDGEKLGLAHGDRAVISENGMSIEAQVTLRSRVRPGTGFLIEGTAKGNANAIGDLAAADVSKAEEAPS